MTTAIAPAVSTLPSAPALDAVSLENVLIKGDLAQLNAQQRMAYLRAVCDSLGLNPLTQPFQYINLSGRLTLYAKRDATEQLRKIHGVGINKIEKEFHDGLYIVTAYAVDKTGRMDASTGAVTIAGLKGENLANALMKAETKAKRRVTLSICGLGLLDETEVESIAGAKPEPVEAPITEVNGAAVNTLTGEVVPNDGLLRITACVKVPTTSNRGCWKLTLSDDREAYTFKEQEAALAESLAQASEPVSVELKESKRGFDLVSLKRFAADEESTPPLDPPAPPIAVHADEIPF